MRRIIVKTYRKANVYEPERVVDYMGHPLNQLQAKSFNWHARRLNAVVRKWQFAGVDFRIAYLNGKEETTTIKKGKVFPFLSSRRAGALDLYNVYNLLPMIGGEPTKSQVYPYLPSKREFLYLRDLTDFRQLLNTD